jgi:hypothetical protein
LGLAWISAPLLLKQFLGVSANSNVLSQKRVPRVSRDSTVEHAESIRISFGLRSSDHLSIPLQVPALGFATGQWCNSQNRDEMRHDNIFCEAESS